VQKAEVDQRGIGKEAVMAGIKVLLEFERPQQEPFSMQLEALASVSAAEDMARSVMQDLPGIGVELDDDVAPIPMFLSPGAVMLAEGANFALEMNAAALDEERRPNVAASTVVVPAQVSAEALEQLVERGDVIVWPNSEITLFQPAVVDCRPFRPAATIAQIQAALGVQPLWDQGFRGEGIVVGIIDEGVDGTTYPVRGGFSRPGAGRQPGTAPVTSHGSMCAADILIAAPDATLYDYPFLGIPNSGGALQMFQAVLNQRAIDGTPHITNNSYGFVGVPDRALFPRHEVHDIQHPVHRKVREVVLAGVPCFFAAGNCGAQCPSGKCQPSGIGPGRSIHASNSLEEVITVAAVNRFDTRIGYSSQGPGMFFAQKPDLATFSHIFGNFGPGRPAGGPATSFDNGTSAATPVAAGAAAALLSAFPGLTPGRLKQAMMSTARSTTPAPGWNADLGVGILDLAAAFASLP
jgi:serine protease AprX